jgi:hypothetical protein
MATKHEWFREIFVGRKMQEEGVAFVDHHRTRVAMQLAQAIVPLDGLAKCS